MVYEMGGDKMSIWNIRFKKKETGKDKAKNEENHIQKPETTYHKTAIAQQPDVITRISKISVEDRMPEPEIQEKAITKEVGPGTYSKKNYLEANTIKWPQFGMSAKNLYECRKVKLMVDSDILCTNTFILFAKVWHACNQANAAKRSIFIPAFEYSTVPEDIKAALQQILSDREIVNLCEDEDYEHLFLRKNIQGPVVFISKTIEKGKRVKTAAYNAHKELRYYTLDEGGNLTGFTKFTEPDQFPALDISVEEKFNISTAITPVKVARNPLKKPIVCRTIVYDDNGSPVVLKSEIMSNATSITYRTDRSGVFAKIYTPKVLRTTYFKDKIQLMLQKPIARSGICWPLSMLHDCNGCFVGALVPQAEGKPLMQSVLGEDQLNREFPSWNKKDLCDLAICILEHIVFLQDRHVFFGCINPQTIFVKDQHNVYFVDMDCYQIEGFPCTSQNITFQPPELQLSGIQKRLYTQQTENYEIAVLVFMLLMPGKIPYVKDKNSNMAQSIADMKFPFSWSSHPGDKEVDRPSGRWRFVWSHLGKLKGDFYNTFMRGKAFNAPEKRKDARFWYHEVTQFRKELERPFDIESLKLFPKTFKRDGKTKFYKCPYCGNEYPEFYFYRRYFNTDYRICNSCINTQSDKSFKCVSVYHTAVDRTFYYSRKMEIFHKLAAQNNPDWHKQKYCSECKHVRASVYKELQCSNCGHNFYFTFGQKEFYDERFGADSWSFPRLCPECQKNRKRF